MGRRQALYFVAPFTVELREEPIPPLTDDKVLVETIVSAISPGTEMLLYRGQMPPDMAVDETIDALTNDMRYPLKYGYAAVGRVVRCGKTVDAGWQDRLVFAFHPHESHFLAYPHTLIPIPTSMDPETAVFLPNMETAVSFLMDGRPMIGEQVTVFGQGIVGLLTTTLLNQLPLGKLITLDSYPLRRDWSTKLGAHLSLDPTEPGAMAQLHDALQDPRTYTGADLTYELSGNPQALDQAIAVTGFNGRIVIGSWYGTKQTRLNLGGRFHRSHMRLISSQVSHIAPQWNGRWNKARRLQTALKQLEYFPPTRLVTHHIPFTSAAHAYQQLHQTPEQTIQLLLHYL
ncbi:MAG: zinc-binding alcohol dehydrogenase [Anaerolineales bacterium]|nr:zinc-binding alcohol dehydrogenase [Anaerolineales bacterium]